MKQPRLLVSLFALCLFLLFVFAYYWNHQSEIGRESTLVGAQICGDLLSKEAQDNCCQNIFSEQPHDQCEGAWQFEPGAKICSFICDREEEVFCTAEAMLCPDNVTYVGRNSSLNCAFNACPQ